MITLSGRTHRDNVEMFYPLFEDAWLRPAFKQEDFDRIKSNTLDYLKNILRYASDEELGKAGLYHFVFAGGSYAHPPEGTVEGLEAITLDDVKAFYAKRFSRENAVSALGGGYTEELLVQFSGAVAGLPSGVAPQSPAPTPEAIDGLQVLLIDKPGADASISFGFPVDVHRGEADFYALWLAVSWLGEHRNSSSHLYQVIREARGMNYGDYAYIEAYPDGGSLQKPPTNVGRRQQLFEVWIRTLPNEKAHFALRAAMRELKNLVDNGLSEEQFQQTRSFLSKYILHFADTTSARLGYAIDDAFYGLDGSHLERFRERMRSVTRDEVNAAIKEHLQYTNVKIAMVTGDAAGMKARLVEDLPSPIAYDMEKPAEQLAEDKEIEAFSLDIDDDDVHIVPVDAFLER
jgi:zinc protease